MNDSNTKHTPGPWFVIDHPNNDWSIQNREIGCGLAIARCYGNSSISNAHLIASAPTTLQQRDKLLVALEELVDWAIEIDVENDDGDYGCSRTWDMLVREGAATQQILHAELAIANVKKEKS